MTSTQDSADRTTHSSGLPSLVIKTPPRNHGRTLLAALAVAVMAAVTVLGIMAATRDTPKPTPTNTVLQERQAAISAATDVYQRWVTLSSAAYTTKSTTGLSAVADDPVIDKVSKNISAYEKEGTKITGARTGKMLTADYSSISDTKIVSLTTCVDTSKVRILDQNGKSIRVPRPGDKKIQYRTQSDVTVQSTHGRQWLVTEDTGSWRPC